MTTPTEGEAALLDRVGTALGRRARTARPLSGGSTVAVLEVEFADRSRAVVKSGPGHLSLEAWMLAELAQRTALPLPAVLHAADDLLVLERLANDGWGLDAAAEADAARHLAALHGRPCGDRFGYDRDTVIGRLPQPNPWTARWVDFFRDHRLLHMAEAGHREGTVSDTLRRRLEALAGRLERYLDEPPHPALLHGDVWTGNVLSSGGHITGFIDPALYIGHPEIELAFATLFDTLGQPFFDVYTEMLPLDAGFFELRRDIYTIYPLLVHVRYWDVAYARPIEATLRRLGL